MISMLWVVLFVALTGAQLGQGLPVRSTPQAYPHDTSGESLVEAWGLGGGLYAAVLALALVLTAVGLLLGCTWCYRHKDCKLFAASATQLHDGRRPPDSGFSEPVNNNVSEDNNNGPISLREMQNIANNNAAAYIVSDNEERNRISRESVVEFEPLPSAIRVADPLEHCADWFAGDDFPRNRLQYLREIGRGWFGRVVEGEMEGEGTSSAAVKILNQNASLEEKARFLDEARLYRDVAHDNVLAFIAKCLQEDPWILMFELCSMDLQQYLVAHRPKMAILNESGVPLQLMCDVASALTHLHSRGYLYGNLNSSNVLVRNAIENPRAVLGNYANSEVRHDFCAPENRRHPPVHTASSEVWSLGTLIWEVCTWGAPVPSQQPPPPDLPCPYRNHLYQVMQLCWNPSSDSRPSSSQVHALLNHLHSTHTHSTPQDDGYGSSDFEERWQRLKPNTIPKVDEHIALVHAPSTSMASHFTGSDQEFDNAPTKQDTLSVDMDTAVSRSSSIMSDKDPLSIQIKSESLTNLHGSLEDVRNIYLTHNETAALECHQGNISFEDSREKEQDRSDSSVDPWVKDLIAGSQDDVSYYKDVSDVIKNLDNILNSEKTSSSESSHQASPSRDNLSLDCKKDYPAQSSMVKSPGITNFKNLLEMGFDSKDDEPCEDDDVDRETIGTLSHSFERHSDTTSQHTLENLTPDTPLKDLDFISQFEEENEDKRNDVSVVEKPVRELDTYKNKSQIKADHEENAAVESPQEKIELPKENIDIKDSKLPKLKDLCVVSLYSVSENEQLNVKEDCVTSCDNNLDEVRTQMKPKSICNTVQSEQQIIETMSVQKLDTSENSADENDSEINIPNEETHYEDRLIKTQETSKNEEKPTEITVEDEILPKRVTEIATNFVENEIILPAEKIVSQKIKEKQAQEHTLPPKIDVRENSENVNTDNTTKPINNCLKQATVALIDEERKVSFDSSIDPNSLQLERVHEIRIEKSSSLDNQDIPPPMPAKPELVQIINDKDTEGTEKSETTNISSEDIILPHEVQNRKEGINKIEKKENNHVENASKMIAEVGNIEDHSLRSDKLESTPSNDSTAYMDLINYTNSKNNNSEIMQDNVKNAILSCLENSMENNSCSIIKNESTEYLDLPSVLIEADEVMQLERVCSQYPDDLICSSTPKGSESSANNTLEATVQNHVDLSETKVPEERITLEATKEHKYTQELLSPFESPTKSHPTDTYDENSSVVLGPFENCTIEYKGFKTVDLPKEEQLAFSSNFSEINLETPSPLRDGNFLNEVPDIALEDLQESVTISEVKQSTDKTDEIDQSATAKHVSPSTPPNSPGIYLASTSQHKYLVDIDLEPYEPTYPPIESVQSDSGLSSLQKDIDLNQIELQITTKLAMAENENNLNIEYSGPLTVEGLVSEDEAILGESDATPEEYLAWNVTLTLDEECVKALRNELELKLPLAQVCGIEPACGDNSESETESEPERLPLPLPAPELILNYAGGALSPIAEETPNQLTKYENDWNTSARTDSSSSYPEPCNDSTAEATELPSAGPSAHYTYTLHGEGNTYTVQKDAPSSKELTMSADSLNGSPFKKPIDASPIDDKTYNKDDEKVSNCERISQISPFLMSPTTETSAPESLGNTTGVSTLSKTTVPTDAKHSKPSECLSKATSIDSWCSNDTLYNVEENFDDLIDADLPFENEIERELVKSASTVTLTHHDDEKEFSHCSTYVVHDSQSEPCETFSPDSITVNDNYTYTKVKTEATVPTPSVPTTDSKNTTMDLAYGTLPTYSNCTTEVVSQFEDLWRIAQPELVRRSPAVEVNITPPIFTEYKETTPDDSPQITTEPIKRMDSVHITYLQDEINDHKSENANFQVLVDIDDTSYTNMAPSVFSTPIFEVVDDNNVQAIPMQLPNDSEILLEEESKSRNSRDSNIVSPRTPNYSDFESSAVNKPQECLIGDADSRNPSSQSIESGMSSGEFRQFENSVRACPQDMSSVIDPYSQFLNSEGKNETTIFDIDTEHPSQNSRTESAQALNIIPPTNAYSTESHVIPNITFSMFVTDLDEEEIDQPHSIIITEVPQEKETTIDEAEKQKEVPKDVLEEEKENLNKKFDSHIDVIELIQNHSNNSHERISPKQPAENQNNEPKVNGTNELEHTDELTVKSPKTEVIINNIDKEIPNGSLTENLIEITCNGNSQNYATVNFISEAFEELIESNVDDKEIKDSSTEEPKLAIEVENAQNKSSEMQSEESCEKLVNGVENKVTVTEDFLQNEKKFCTLNSYLPMLSDIRFTGPASEIMSTSFNTQDSPTDPASPECEQDNKKDVVADIVKEWDSDTESHSSNSSSGEFIWKDCDGHETAVVPNTHFDHQQKGPEGGSEAQEERQGPGSGESGSGSGSGSEGDEVEFVPSSWDCRAAPSKSSLRSLEQTPDSKKRVVFKRQKYHCVYEYPRELPDLETHSPAYLPDLSTYCEWDPTSAEEAELGYGQLYGTPMDMFPLRAGIAFGADYDEDFYISSSARPFESLGIMSTSSQFFPGMHLKPQLLDRDIDDVPDEFPPPPSPLATTLPTRTPSLDFTTPDSGVEDITPGSTGTDEDFKAKKLPESEIAPCWKPVDSGSSSESVSPSSPGGEALGGLRHTRDKLKLDLPPSPHIPSPRHNRVFNFVLDKPKRHRIPDEKPPEIRSTPLIMTDETPVITTSLPIQKDAEDVLPPEPTFSTFGKCKSDSESDTEQKIILTDDVQEESPSEEVKEESPVKVEPVKGEGTVLDSGDEDSGIESSSKATLERKTNVS